MNFDINAQMAREAKYQKTLSLTMDEVLGNNGHKGLVVARGLPSMSKKEMDALKKEGYNHPTRCPIWGDTLPYKSLTVVCEEKDYEAVDYWLGYIHGGENISGCEKQKDGKIAMRSNYMCW